MVLKWYECEVCHVEYPHEDEAHECEHKHGKKMIEVYYGGEGRGLSYASGIDGSHGISGVDGWLGAEPRKKRKRR